MSFQSSCLLDTTVQCTDNSHQLLGSCRETGCEISEGRDKVGIISHWYKDTDLVLLVNATSLVLTGRETGQETPKGWASACGDEGRHWFPITLHFLISIFIQTELKDNHVGIYTEKEEAVVKSLGFLIIPLNLGRAIRQILAYEMFVSEGLRDVQSAMSGYFVQMLYPEC